MRADAQVDAVNLVGVPGQVDADLVRFEIPKLQRGQTAAKSADAP